MRPVQAPIPVPDEGAPFLLTPRVFRALSSAKRAAILHALRERPHTPAELGRRLGVSEATVRGHLEVLRDAGLAVRRDDGRAWAYHVLTPQGRALLAGGPARALAVLATGGGAAGLGALSLLEWRSRLPEPPPPLSMPVPVPPDPLLPWLFGAGAAGLAVGTALVLLAAAAWRRLRG